MGKGSERRPESIAAFNRGYESINWGAEEAPEVHVTAEFTVCERCAAFYVVGEEHVCEAPDAA